MFYSILFASVVILTAAWIAAEAIRSSRADRFLRRFSSPSQDDRQFFRRIDRRA